MVGLADRTQAPSGAGYALENRIVLLRSLPETFRDCQVHRLASFFARNGPRCWRWRRSRMITSPESCCSRQGRITNVL
jgi:hypothetical protein